MLGLPTKNPEAADGIGPHEWYWVCFQTRGAMEMARYGRIVIRLRGRVRGQLRKLMQTTHDARLRTRLNAVLLYADGRRTEEIASVLGCSTSTAIRAANGFLADGVAGLVDRRCENGSYEPEGPQGAEGGIQGSYRVALSATLFSGAQSDRAIVG